MEDWHRSPERQDRFAHMGSGPLWIVVLVLSFIFSFVVTAL